jgi:hypothetical protein
MDTRIYVQFYSLFKVITGIDFPQENDLRALLQSGVILCELVYSAKQGSPQSPSNIYAFVYLLRLANALKKDSIKRINRGKTPIAAMDNVNLFLNVCQHHFGIVQANLFDLKDLRTTE